MLTTRCPNCQTTFRITSVALHKATGQVRCGQCETVFSAFDSLTDTLTGIPVEDNLHSTVTEITPAFAAAEPMPEEAVPEEAVPATEPTEPAAALPTDASDAAPDAEPAPAEIPWHPIERAAKPPAPIWRTAAAIAAVALLLQCGHHFRSTLVQMPVIGGVLDRAYSLAGMPVIEAVDPEQFTIVNWVATAQSEDAAAPDAAASLAISTGVRNTSDAPLPYPMLSLKLTDRWEETIGARVFTPDEYMGTRLARSARIRPNSTVTAQLQLVDPGPDAYGFEVDICVAIDEQRMRCKKSNDPFR